MTEFSIFNLEDFELVGEETMGTSARDWYKATSGVSGLEADRRWLFKVPPIFEGEIWSEKIAEEIARQMGLSVARVELAKTTRGSDAQMGTITRNFADERVGFSLEHGNELMEVQEKRKDYVLDEDEGQVGLDAVYDYLQAEGVRPPPGSDDGRDAAFFFSGYLVLDALIGNVDRHHENWGVVQTSDGTRHLAPTFDHAACLGRELQQKKRSNYLDNDQVDQYASNKKAVAKITPPGENDRVVPYQLLDFLPQLGQAEALCYWVEAALEIDDATIQALFQRLPAGLAGPEAVTFARRFTEITRRQLRRREEEIC